MGRRDQFLQDFPKAEVVMPPLVLQMAGDAKIYSKTPFLKPAGAWIVGREHERSAWSHIALFLTMYRKQFLR